MTRATKRSATKPVEPLAFMFHAIPQVPLPKSDPVYGEKGPLLELWRK